MNANLISEQTLKAYENRYIEMQKHQNTDKGRELFVSTLSATSEQIENMHVKATIGDFEVENDGPPPLGGSGIITPMPLLLATIANCLEITALLYLSYQKVNVTSLKVKVEATHDKRSVLEPENEPLPGFYDMKYTWIINTSEDHKKIEEALDKIDEICPVKCSMRGQRFTKEIVFL